MLAKPEGCSACVLRDKGLGFVPDKIVPDAHYVLQGEAPGRVELERGEPFVGPAGFVLTDWMMKAVPILRLEYERGHVSITNTLRCLPPEIQGRAYPRGDERLQAEACCRQYENLGNAHTVVLLGESSQRSVFGTELEAEDATDRQLGHQVKGVLGRIGRVIAKDGRQYVFAPHPAFVLRQPALVSHGQAALAIATGSDTILDVNYVDWSTGIETLLREV